ncbi:hypothetical protein GCM10023219_03160 [Stakelama sediminis]|uniref:Tetratricopeptide repeat protein n=1 Tax=Stakelama sediminis TaxID=463200 RepID=A0A840YZH6_9SPHN|nr:hypothetical protein [Stakelama sediminis]MBB5719053.1 hypothetical protein [Stakelama sediminis]
MIGLFAALLLLQAVPQPAPPSDAEAAQKAQTINTLPTDAAKVDAMAKLIASLPSDSRIRPTLICWRSSLIQKLKRPDALAEARQCAQVNPDFPPAQWMLIQALLDKGLLVEAAHFIETGVQEKPELFARLDSDTIASLARRLDYAGQSEEKLHLLTTLADAGFHRDHPMEYSGYAEAGIRQHLARNDSPAAVKLLDGVLDPQDILTMLVDRRYQAIWPDIEQWSGGTLAKQRDALVAHAQTEYQYDPNPQKRLDLANALYSTGHPAEAIAMLQKEVAEPDAMKTIGEFGYVMTLIRLTRFRQETGDGDLDSVTALERSQLSGPIASGNPQWNLVPNLAKTYLMADKPARALALLNRFDTSKNAGLEDAQANGYFVALRACALYGMGNSDTAAPLVNTLEQKFSANKSALIIGVGCTSDQTAQIALIRSALEDPSRRGDMLLNLTRARQAADMPPTDPTDILYRKLVKTPQIKALLAQYARPLPPSYIPALHEWRKPA